MSDVWVGIVNRFVEKLFNVKGGPTVVDIDPSVRAVLPLQSGNENRYLQGWTRFGVTCPISAVAANNGVARIRNPAGSNVIAVVESVIAINSAGADAPFVTWGASVSDFSTIVSTTFSRIDARGIPQPTCIISSQAAAAGANFNQSGCGGQNQPAQFVPTINCEYTVLPGQIFQCQSNVANTIFTVSFLWRERVAETSELT